MTGAADATIVEVVLDASSRAIDAATLDAARRFLRSLPDEIPANRALLFGSRSRGEHHQESDTDLAVILQGTPGSRWSVSAEMARLAFDILMDTDVLIDPLAIWETELAQPERSSDPDLILAILRDGVPI